MIYDVAIIGASASGMACAVTAARRGLTVLLIEKNTQAGRKLRATGNGKCNIANRYYDPSCYRGSCQPMIRELVGQNSYKKTLDFMSSLGLAVTEKNGYYYPASLQATSVIQVLSRAMEHGGVTCCPGRLVTDIRFEENKYYISAELSKEYEKEAIREAKRAKKSGEAVHQVFERPSQDSFLYEARNVVLATGGCAGSQYGCNGEGYALAERFGHHVITPLPALVPLTSNDSFCKALAGVRVSGNVAILVDSHEIYKTMGEVQFTEYGASGICVFGVSRFAAKALELGKQVVLRMDLMPKYTMHGLMTELQMLFGSTTYLSVIDSLSGLVPNKLAGVVLARLGIEGMLKAEHVKAADQRRIAQQLKCFDMHINGCKDYDMAQVTAGGVDLTEITKDFESKLQSSLYIIGELLDVDGTCGGYNLTFAFLSGVRAGEKIV